MTHGIIKCKYCYTTIRQCRCMDHHEVSYSEFCNPECERRERVNQHQVANDEFASDSWYKTMAKKEEGYDVSAGVGDPKSAEEWAEELMRPGGKQQFEITKITITETFRRAQSQARREAIQDCIQCFSKLTPEGFGIYVPADVALDKVRALLEEKK